MVGAMVGGITETVFGTAPLTMHQPWTGRAFRGELGFEVSEDLLSLGIEHLHQGSGQDIP
jgi:hypothetical protein